jgi:leucyl-tRNA synthetase
MTNAYIRKKMEYNFREVERKWQRFWAENKTFRANNASDKPKYYVLDMFPYPSGAGLHVGHPLGYIASDIYARYKRLKGFNVLHPMGYDSFGLPAEQYAIQTGQHPAITTEQNIKRYREQLDNLGFSFDWEREVRTSDPAFYKWTQWIFLKLFHSWYNPETNKAEPIDSLIKQFEIRNPKSEMGEWKSLNEKQRSDVLMDYRLAFLSEAYVNWCPALGTVLANDEVKDGVSERGGYPVERKLMKQWSLRITAYAQRLLDDLETIDWPESLKEQQRNWIGRSEGSSLRFEVRGLKFEVEVFTTRPDTVFGATFLTLAPEHDLVEKITTAEQKTEVDKYVTEAKNRSERERMTEVKRITGVFTGAYAVHPFTNENIPIWIGDYVLAGYGTGAVMAVPAHDTRDFAFAKHFNLPITKVIVSNDKSLENEECFDTYDGYAVNSDFINGLQVKDAIKKIIGEIEKHGLGKGKVNYRLRDAVFGRQRYWGEPIPVYYKDGIPHTVDEKDLPVILPEVDKYLPTEDGEPPLARAKDWKYKGQYDYEMTTMPGWAGSSWYYLRYMDAHNEKEFASKDALHYWQDVDLYIGGAEHATGHLLYVRFWTKFLNDLGYISIKEPAKKLINQGMIQGVSQYHEEIRIHRNLITHYWENDVPKVLKVYKDNNLLKSFDIPARTKEENKGFNIYKNHNCKLQFKLFEKQTGKEIPLEESFVGLSKAYFVKEVSSQSQTLAVHTLKEAWLKVEQHFNPIVITDYPVQAYWYYEENKYNPDDNRDVWKYLNENNEKIDLNKVIPLWTSQPEVEKMSKSKWNVVSPGDETIAPTYELDKEAARQSKYWKESDSFIVNKGIIEQHGADAFRLYEMFLGPLELSKPWNTNGISGTSNFIRKLWRLFHPTVSDEAANRKELKSLHKLIKKVTEDIERFSFNTSVSNFMICINELTDLKCNKREILKPLLILVSPYAPHVAEELWEKLGHKESITFAKWPTHKEEFLEEDVFAYPISVNGKMKMNLSLSLALNKEQVEDEVLKAEEVKKVLGGQTPKKIVVVPGRIVNIVV